MNETNLEEKIQNKKRNNIIIAYSVVGLVVISILVYSFAFRGSANENSNVDYQVLCDAINSRTGERNSLESHPEGFERPTGFSGRGAGAGSMNQSSMGFMQEIRSACEDGKVDNAEDEVLDKLLEDMPEGFIDTFMNQKRPER